MLRCPPAECFLASLHAALRLVLPLVMTLSMPLLMLMLLHHTQYDGTMTCDPDSPVDP